MAMADYRQCDVCGCKTFYDANLDYQHDPDRWRRQVEPYRVTGAEGPGLWLQNLGDWAVICSECAKTHKTAIVPIKPELDDADE